MLPQIFRTDDVLLEIEFAPEQRLALEKLLAGLPRQTFLADDSLGWVYQFWQTKKKDEVNKAGAKIDGRTLPAVTQLFTEDYMVQFLLHNTIGAWWCARNGIKGPAGGAGVPAGRAPIETEYLRWREDGTPAAGTFDGWPKTLTEFTMLDPCCGSGHFLVSAFNLLVPLRMHDEKLTDREACDAVLRDNLFGLELDPRCTQIAAFALALATWKYPGADGQPLGYRSLPLLNIACSGQGVVGEREEWQALANSNRNLRITLGYLYDLFQKAPDLGSLIDPRTELGAPGFTGTLADVQPLLVKALAKHAESADLAAVGVAAQGIARAAELLSDRYTLVMTNVPYLGRGKHDDVMKEYVEEHYKEGKADLATAFVLRCLELCRQGGSTALVTPQNWLFLTTYKKLREILLKEQTWNVVARLGTNAFRDMNWWAATTALITITADEPPTSWKMFGIDVSSNKDQKVKAARLADREPTPMRLMVQMEQLRNPDAVVGFANLQSESLLGNHSTIYQGVSTGDGPRYCRKWWEIANHDSDWDYFHESPERDECRGLTGVLHTQQGRGPLAYIGTAKKGLPARGKLGVAIGVTGKLPRMRFLGNRFDGTVAVLIPIDPTNLAAVSLFVESDTFIQAVRAVDQALSVTESSFVKVPFDLAHWQTVAAEKYPNGLPEAHSDDPTQWLFKGEIATSTDPLQVVVARLLGYRWPDQPKEPDAVDDLADPDGIVCLPGVRGKVPGAERLLEVLRAAYGATWSDAVLHKLLTETGCKAGTTFDDWLRNQFFEQHCKRFHHLPFIWQVWDGRKDGFSALVNYHKLSHKSLENLTYSFLGDWITAQAADAKAGRTGADLRLKSAQDLQEKLKAILASEPPYDIFVRWKPLHEQPIGWNPDLNDGVRANIRPFVEAGVLRKNPNIKWTKDRGKEPERDKDEYPWFWSGSIFTGERVNDIHLTNAVKTAARDKRTAKGGQP